MSDLKIWAKDLALIILSTGIFIKFTGDKGERKILRFVIMLIIFSCVFRLNTDSLKNEFSTDIKENIEEKTADIEDELSQYINSASKKKIASYARDTVKNYDENADVICDIGDEAVNIIIKSKIISSQDISEIRSKLKNEFDCEINIETGE